MKKEFVILLTLLLLTSFAISADDETTTDKTSDLKDKVSSTKIGEIGTQTKAQANNVLENEIDVPDWIEAPAKIILGIEDGMTIQRLIIVLGIWIGFFILILSITPFLPVKGRIIKVLAALVITALVSVTKALDAVAQFFLDIAGFFSWTESWAPLRMIIAIILAAATIYGFGKLSKAMKRRAILDKAEKRGINADIASEIDKEKIKDLD